MSRPRVSVVIPAYNRGSTIDSALASVRGQIHQADEIVIVDDSSDDDTAARVESWADQLPVTLLRNATNKGCGAARARAVAAASGDIIAPLDGDDVWLPDHLSTLVPLASDPSRIVATRYRRWQPDRGMDVHASSAATVPAPRRQAKAILLDNFLFSGSLAWRESIMAIGGGSTARRADDWEGWIRLIVEARCTAVPAPHATVLYRAHLGSLSALDGCLPEEVELLEALRTEPTYQPYVRVLQAALRRRRARRVFLDGTRAAADGDSDRARRLFLNAMRTDPSPRGLIEPGATGSVALRAAVGAVSPWAATRARVHRLRRKALVDEPITGPSSATMPTVEGTGA